MSVDNWYQEYSYLSVEDKYYINAGLQLLPFKPKISLVVPVFNTKMDWLYECIESVCNQIYPNWELCLCDNGSDTQTTSVLRDFLTFDRIKIIRSETNVEGAEGTNLALSLSTGEYVGLLDSDDVLTQDALSCIIAQLNLNPDINIIYTDEIVTDSNLVPLIPFFKPEYDANLLCNIPYVGHLVVYRTELIKKLQMRQCGGSYDLDLILRASLTVLPTSIVHLPVMIYKYRSNPDSTSAKTKQSCIDGGLLAIQQYLNSIKPNSSVSYVNNLYKIYLASGEELKTTVIISPYSDYPNFKYNLLAECFPQLDIVYV